MTCGACGTAFDPLSATKHSYQKKSSFESICICSNCGAGNAWPSLTDQELGKIYSEGDYWKSYKVTKLSPRNNPGHYAAAKARWQFVEDYLVKIGKEDVSILDVGAGYGFFGLAASQSKKVHLKRLCTVEMDKFFQQSLELTWRESYSHVQFSCHHQLDQVSDSYDVIVLSHILEHLNDPSSLLKAAGEKLAVNGVILIDVPHQDFIFKDDVFPHVVFFNEQGLNTLINRSGLVTKTIGSFGRRRQELVNRPGWLKSVMALEESIVYKLRHILPVFMCVWFFEWLLRPASKDKDGVWLRALAAHKSS
jgi:SAM-dependent methyltransferase